MEKEDTNKAVPMEETREDDDVLDLLDEEDNAKLTVHVNGMIVVLVVSTLQDVYSDHNVHLPFLHSSTTFSLHFSL